MQDDGDLSAQADKEWASALLKIKRKDPSIYDTSTQLFSEGPLVSGDDVPDGKAKQTHNPKTLRQILYDQVCALMQYVPRPPSSAKDAARCCTSHSMRIGTFRPGCGSESCMNQGFAGSGRA